MGGVLKKSTRENLPQTSIQHPGGFFSLSVQPAQEHADEKESQRKTSPLFPSSYGDPFVYIGLLLGSFLSLLNRMISREKEKVGIVGLEEKDGFSSTERIRRTLTCIDIHTIHETIRVSLSIELSLVSICLWLSISTTIRIEIFR